MYRRIIENLRKWKAQENRKPLIIKGARQVGKTYAIREFGKLAYDDVIEINFERDLRYVEFFNKTRDPHDIMSYIELEHLNVNFATQNVVLFFDEIQACPNALTALKFLAEECPCDIICSGSMLGVAIAGSSSFPVGYVETWTMFPMDFIEFLYALQVQQKYIDQIIDAYHRKIEIPEGLHQQFTKFFTSYVLCGGMPEVVATYVKTNSFAEVIKVQRRIVSDYKNDLVKYGTGSEKIKAQECYASLPLQLAKENKKFQYKLVQKGYNARYYDASLRWLEETGLIYKVHRLASITTPLEIAKELNVFKVYMADTGLLLSQFDDSIIQQVFTGDLTTYKGVIYENIGAQILAQGSYKSYYYEPTTSSEIDFVIMYKHEITPIEVKAGIHTKSRSFQNFIKNHECKYSFRLSNKNLGFEQGTTYLPLYLFPFLIHGLLQEK